MSEMFNLTSGISAGLDLVVISQILAIIVALLVIFGVISTFINRKRFFFRVIYLSQSEKTATK
jgi:hypothetical protein